MGYTFDPARAEFSNGTERGRLTSRPDPANPDDPQSGTEWALQRPDADHSLIPVLFPPVTRESVRAVVTAMSARELDDVVTGRVRLTVDEAINLAIWNAAIDRENGYES
jgi:hypothetical protein